MPERQNLDLILTHDGPIFTVRSPQLPGLIGGRSSLSELQADLPGMLEFAGVDLANFRTRVHTEELLTIGGNEIVVRWARDKHLQEREATLARLQAALAFPGQLTKMLDIPRTATGEALFIVGVPSDTVRWIAEQLLPSADAAAVIVPVAEEGLWTTYFSVGATSPGLPTVADRGMDMETQLSEIMRAEPFEAKPKGYFIPVSAR